MNLGTLPDDAYAAVNYTATSLFGKGHIQGIDNKLGLIDNGSLVQTGVVDPVATLVVPDYAGQIFLNTLTKEVWISASIVPGDWIDVVENLTALNDLTDVLLVSSLDGDILMFDGANWINTKEIGAGHTRNGVLTAALLGGATGTVFPGDGIAPYAGTRGVGIGGQGTEVYGDDSVALNDGESFGNRSLASGGGKAYGNYAFAHGSARAAGTGSVAFQDADSGGQSSFAMGNSGTRTGWGSLAITLSNVGPNLEVVIPAEDLTSIFTGGQTIQLFDFAGGTYDPTTGAAGDASVLSLLVDSSAFGGGNTTLTVLGVNHNAASGFLNYDSRGLHSFAFGENVQAHQNHSMAFGEAAAAWGDHSFAFGESVETGEVGATPQPEYALAFGFGARALHDHGQAFGANAQTRNYGERSFALGQFTAVEWSQERIFLLNNTIGIAGGTTPLYTDAFIGGTDEIATFSDHGYAVTAVVLGTVDIGGTVQCAAWKLEAVFKNDSGTLTQVGTTTTTLLANGDATTFDTAPVFAISGQDIRINVADDGNGAEVLDWSARVVVVELAAR